MNFIYVVIIDVTTWMKVRVGNRKYIKTSRALIIFWRKANKWKRKMKLTRLLVLYNVCPSHASEVKREGIQTLLV